MQDANKLMHDLSTTEQHSSQIERDVKSVDNELKHIDRDLKISKKINTSLSELNSALGEAVELLEVVSIVPEIGAEASELKKTISTFKAPVSAALKASNKLEDVVGPIRTKIEQIEPKVKTIDNALLKLMNAENQSITVLGDAVNCINALPSGDFKTGLETKLDNTSKTIDSVVVNFDNVQITILNTINEAHRKLEGILNISNSLTGIFSSIQSVFNVLNPLISALNRVKDALSHVIRVPYGGYPKFCHKWGIPYPCGWHTVYFSFSVEQILRGVTGVLAPIMDLLNKAMDEFLKPILNALHLNITLPTIPGLSNIENLVDQLKVFGDIDGVLNDLFKDLSQFETLTSDIEKYIKELSQINSACLTHHK